MLTYTRIELSGLKKLSGKNLSLTFFYLEKAIELVNEQAKYIADFVDCPLKHKTVKLKWLGTLVDYVEWVYGLHEYLSKKGEKTSLRILFEVFNPIFGFKDFQFSSYFGNIKSRVKGERTTLLDLQKKLLMQRLEKLDLMPPKK